MSVLPASFVVLVRARKALAKAYQNSDWQGVEETDAFLGYALTQAFDDPGRDPEALGRELNKILELYSRIVGRMPEHIQRAERSPERVV